MYIQKASKQVIFFFLCMLLLLPSYVQAQTENRSYVVAQATEGNIVKMKKRLVLQKENGDEIYFWAKNIGKDGIAITINGKDKQVLAPGEEGEISLQADKTSGRYLFQATPVSKQKKVSLSYVIGQRGVVTAIKANTLEENSIQNKDRFISTHSLTDKNGKYVNFWIRNTGKTPITLTINGMSKRTIAPGSQGHIAVKAGHGKKKYLFQAVPRDKNGTFSMKYRIAQKDTDTRR